MDWAKLQQALYEHGTTAIRRIRAARPHNNFYSFAFYTSGEFAYAFFTSASHEGLEEAVAAYLQQPRYAECDPTTLRRSLKWSPCDSPLYVLCAETCGELQEIMNEVCKEYSSIEDESEAQGFAKQVEAAFLEALRRIDSGDHAGSPEQRLGLVLNLLMGDQSDEDRLRFAALVNPPTVVASFAADLALAYEE
jgi:Domain of unknown function (DUF4303)